MEKMSERRLQIHALHLIVTLETLVPFLVPTNRCSRFKPEILCSNGVTRNAFMSGSNLFIWVRVLTTVSHASFHNVPRFCPGNAIGHMVTPQLPWFGLFARFHSIHSHIPYKPRAQSTMEPMKMRTTAVAKTLPTIKTNMTTVSSKSFFRCPFLSQCMPSSLLIFLPFLPEDACFPTLDIGEDNQQQFAARVPGASIEKDVPPRSGNFSDGSVADFRHTVSYNHCCQGNLDHTTFRREKHWGVRKNGPVLHTVIPFLIQTASSC